MTFWETATLSSKYRDGHKARFVLLYFERLLENLRHRFGLSKRLKRNTGPEYCEWHPRVPLQATTGCEACNSWIRSTRRRLPLALSSVEPGNSLATTLARSCESKTGIDLSVRDHYWPWDPAMLGSDLSLRWRSTRDDIQTDEGETCALSPFASNWALRYTSLIKLVVTRLPHVCSCSSPTSNTLPGNIRHTDL